MSWYLNNLSSNNGKGVNCLFLAGFTSTHQTYIFSYFCVQTVIVGCYEGGRVYWKKKVWIPQPLPLCSIVSSSWKCNNKFLEYTFNRSFFLPQSFVPIKTLYDRWWSFLWLAKFELFMTHWANEDSGSAPLHLVMLSLHQQGAVLTYC